MGCGEEGCMVKGACVVKRVWVAGDVCDVGRAWQSMHGRGMHVWQEGMCCKGVCMTGETATSVDCAHPTGMYSCLLLAIIGKYGIQLANELDNNLLEEVLILHFDTLQEEHSLLTDP